MLCQHCGQRESTIHEVLIDPDGVRMERHVCEACEAALLGGNLGGTLMSGGGSTAGPGTPGGGPTFIVAGPSGMGAAAGPAAGPGLGGSAGPIGPMIQAVVGATIAGKLGQAVGQAMGQALGEALGAAAMGAGAAGSAAAGEGGATSLAACPSCGLLFTQFRQTGMLGCAACYEAFVDRLGPLIERTHEGAACHVGKAPARRAEREAALAELRRRLRSAVASERFEAAAQIREEIRALALDAEAGAPAPGDAAKNGGTDA